MQIWCAIRNVLRTAAGALDRINVSPVKTTSMMKCAFKIAVLCLGRYFHSKNVILQKKMTAQRILFFESALIPFRSLSL